MDTIDLEKERMVELKWHPQDRRDALLDMFSSELFKQYDSPHTGITYFYYLNHRINWSGSQTSDFDVEFFKAVTQLNGKIQR